MTSTISLPQPRVERVAYAIVRTTGCSSVLRSAPVPPWSSCCLYASPFLFPALHSCAPVLFVRHCCLHRRR